MIAKKDHKIRAGAYIRKERRFEFHYDIKKGDDVSALKLEKRFVDALVKECVIDVKKNNRREV